jgi:hypothetical protein
MRPDTDGIGKVVPSTSTLLSPREVPMPDPDPRRPDPSAESAESPPVPLREGNSAPEEEAEAKTRASRPVFDLRPAAPPPLDESGGH